VAELGRLKMDAVSHRTRSACGQGDWIQGKSDRIFTDLQALADRHYDEVKRAFANGQMGNASQQGLK
jgi:hypothetical protein